MENKQIEDKLHEKFKDNYKVTKISGDASSRSYYRAIGEKRNVIISIDNENSMQNKDFYKLTNYIKNKVKTPEIYYVNEDKTFLVQADIGTVTFLDKISLLKDQDQELLLKLAIDDMLSYQSIDIEEFKTISTYEFDDSKIDFEVELANAFFVKQYLKKIIKSEVYNHFRNRIKEVFRDYKEVVCHRDYHSRNLMISNEEIVHIDYQDARIGPRTYDLVSLLEDCYIDYDDRIKEVLIDYYVKQSNLNRNEFDKQYHYVAVQRLFKALGSFAYLKIEKNKPQYEKYISKTFERLRYHLNFISEFDEFRIEICKAFYEN